MPVSSNTKALFCKCSVVFCIQALTFPSVRDGIKFWGRLRSLHQQRLKYPHLIVRRKGWYTSAPIIKLWYPEDLITADLNDFVVFIPQHNNAFESCCGPISMAQESPFVVVETSWFCTAQFEHSFLEDMVGLEGHGMHRRVSPYHISHRLELSHPEDIFQSGFRSWRRTKNPS